MENLWLSAPVRCCSHVASNTRTPPLPPTRMHLLFGGAKELFLQCDGEIDRLTLEVGEVGVEHVDVQDDPLPSE